MHSHSMSLALIATLLLNSACGDCRNLPLGIECDENGRCWVQHPDWTARAQAFDFDGLQAGLDDGIFEPWDPPMPSSLVACWQYGSRGDYGHICSLSTECYDLHAIPVDELWGAGGPCDVESYGDWDYTIDTAFGCYGVFEELALAVAIQA